MHDCEKTLDHIYEYINANDLDSELSFEIARHLEICRNCFSRLEFERRLLARMSAANAAPCPEILKKRVQKALQKF